MNVSVSTPAQLQAVLKSLRSSRGFSQAELGKRIGVSQRRVAAIEAAPGRASFDQVCKIILNLGARLSVADLATESPEHLPKRKATQRLNRSEKALW